MNEDGTIKKKKKNKGVSLGGGGHTMSILDLLQHIVNEPAPKLIRRSQKKKDFPEMAKIVVDACLHKEPRTRKSPQELLVCLSKSSLKRLRPDARYWYRI